MSTLLSHTQILPLRHRHSTRVDCAPHVAPFHLHRNGWYRHSCRPPRPSSDGSNNFYRLHASITAAATPARSAGWDPDSAEWLTEQQDIGPAFAASLDLLNWKQLCSILSNHASTAVGKRMCQELLVPEAQAVSEQLLVETRAMLQLELEFSSLLDFGGIQSSEAQAALALASKGGLLSAAQLRAIVSLCAGATKVRRQVETAQRQHRANGRAAGLAPLVAAVGRVAAPAALLRDINSSVDEEGRVQDSASEQLRAARMRVKAVTGRINAILKNYPGEASERGGRLCLAAPSGTKLPTAVLLGQSVGGGLVYLEPAAVVPLNNELMGARGEAAAAEEAVLWELSGRVMGVLEDLSAMMEVITWLDVLAAKARFGSWLGGVLPEFTPWEQVFQPRSANALAALQQQQAEEAAAAEEEGTSSSSKKKGRKGQGQRVKVPPAVQLRGLSHPLLLAQYLVQKEALERQLRLKGGASPSPGGKPQRLLGTRKEVLLASYASPASSIEEEEVTAADLAARLARLRPPRPLDLVVAPHTSVVVITGPNTGGKTATMTAFGLAVAMGKAGIPVPAEGPARFPCYTAVLADIGDEQSLTANLSTFSGHLKRIQRLRGEADNKALLLLDELGTGTDPTEGAVLGTALLKRLVRGGVGAGALTLATTHHSTMTSLKFEDPRFENASVEFDDQALAPTYKLLWGIPGRSNALNIAERLGLDPNIVAAARTRLGAGVAASNAAIGRLEVVAAQVEGERLAAWAVEQQLGALQDQQEGLTSAISNLRERLSGERQQRFATLVAAAAAMRASLEQERGLQYQQPPAHSSSSSSNAETTLRRLSEQLDLAMNEDVSGVSPLDRLKAAAALKVWEATAGNAASRSVAPDGRPRVTMSEAELRAARASGVDLGGVAVSVESSPLDAEWVVNWRGLLEEAAAVQEAAASGLLTPSMSDTSDLEGGMEGDAAGEDLAAELDALRHSPGALLSGAGAVTSTGAMPSDQLPPAQQQVPDHLKGVLSVLEGAPGAARMQQQLAAVEVVLQQQAEAEAARKAAADAAYAAATRKQQHERQEREREAQAGLMAKLAELERLEQQFEQQQQMQQQQQAQGPSRVSSSQPEQATGRQGTTAGAAAGTTAAAAAAAVNVGAAVSPQLALDISALEDWPDGSWDIPDSLLELSPPSSSSEGLAGTATHTEGGQQPVPQQSVPAPSGPGQGMQGMDADLLALIQELEDMV